MQSEDITDYLKDKSPRVSTTPPSSKSGKHQISVQESKLGDMSTPASSFIKSPALTPEASPELTPDLSTIKSSIKELASPEKKKVSKKRKKSVKVKVKKEVDYTALRHQEIRTFTQQVIDIFVPVSLTMLLVVATMKTSKYFHKNLFASLSGSETSRFASLISDDEDKEKDWTGIFLGSLVLVLVVLVLVVSMSFGLVLAFKYKWYRLLRVWMIISPLLILFIIGWLYIEQFLIHYNIPWDYITHLIFLFNFAVCGCLAISWKAPLKLQQAYLVILGALMSVTFIMIMPKFTPYLIVSFLVVWDLVAVLCPKGPLKMLLELSNENESVTLPAIVYTSAMLWSIVRMNIQAIHQDEPLESNPAEMTAFETPEEKEQLQNPQVSIEDVKKERKKKRKVSHSLLSEYYEGVQLGLGDFIFYSVLVAKVSMEDSWYTVMACFLSILVGLGFTMFLLIVYNKALPALPISITFGLVASGATHFFATPFLDALGTKQVFI